MTVMVPFLEQNFSRIRSDTNSPDGGTPTWETTENQSTALSWSASDGTLRIRFVISNSGNANYTGAFLLYVSYNSGTYQAVNATSSYVRPDTNASTAADETSIATGNFLLSAGGGTAIAGGYDEDGSLAVVTPTGGGEYFEVEYGISLVSGDLSPNDTLDFRVYTSTPSELDQYDTNSTPRISITASSVTATASITEADDTLSSNTDVLIDANSIYTESDDYSTVTETIVVTSRLALTNTNYTTVSFNKFTWENVDIGTASEDRIVVVAIASDVGANGSAADPPYIEFNGSNGTILANSIFIAAWSAVAYAIVNTGTTVNVGVYPGESRNYTEGSGHIWTITGANVGHTDILSWADNSTNGADADLSVNVGDNGVLFGVGFLRANSTATWSGLTEILDANTGEAATVTIANEEGVTGATPYTANVVFSVSSNFSASIISFDPNVAAGITSTVSIDANASITELDDTLDGSGSVSASAIDANVTYTELDDYGLVGTGNLTGPVTLTEYSNNSTGYVSGPWTTGSFTPSDNSLLVCIITFGSSGDANPLDDISVTTSGQIWELQAYGGNTLSQGGEVLIYTTEVETGSSMTVTMERGELAARGPTIWVYEFTNYNKSDPIGAILEFNEDGRADGAFSQALTSTSKSDSIVIAAIAEYSIGVITTGSGWTQLEYNQVDAVHDRTSHAQYYEGSTANVDWTAGGNGNVSAAALEINAKRAVSNVNVLIDANTVYTEENDTLESNTFVLIDAIPGQISYYIKHVRVNGGPVVSASVDDPISSDDWEVDDTYNTSGTNWSDTGDTDRAPSWSYGAYDSSVPSYVPSGIWSNENFGALMTMTVSNLTVGKKYLVRIYTGASSSEGGRTFDISINGTLVWNEFDPVATFGNETGGCLEHTFKATATTAELIFTGVINNAVWNALEVLEVVYGVNESDDLLDSSGSVISGIGASVNYTELNDTLDSNTFVLIDANATITELNDTLDGSGTVADAPVITLTERANLGTPSSSNTTHHTWSGVSIGTASDDRVVVLAMSADWLAVSSTQGVTIGGETATVIQTDSGGVAGSLIAYATVTSGTTADIIIEANGSEDFWVGTVYTLTGAATTPLQSNTDNQNGVTVPTADVSTVSDGVIIATAYARADDTSSWTGATEDYTNSVNGRRGSQASNSSTTSGTTTVNPGYDVDQNKSLVVTSWQPALTSIDANGTITESDDLLDSNTNVLIDANATITELNDTLESNTTVDIDANYSISYIKHVRFRAHNNPLSANGSDPISSDDWEANGDGDSSGTNWSETGSNLTADTPEWITYDPSIPSYVPNEVFDWENYGNPMTITVSNLTVGKDYLVRIYTGEGWWALSGSRVFDITINGTLVWDDLDITDTYGKDVAICLEHTFTATGTSTTIVFTASVDNGCYRAIEVLEVVYGVNESDDLLDSNTNVLIDANASITELNDTLDGSGSVGATGTTHTYIGDSYSVTAGTSFSADLTVQEGDLVIAIVGERSGGAHSAHTCTDENGGTWTKIEGHDNALADLDARHSVSVWYHIATAADEADGAAWTVSGTTTGSSGQILVTNYRPSGSYAYTAEASSMNGTGAAGTDLNDAAFSSGNTGTVSGSDLMVFSMAFGRKNAAAGFSTVTDTGFSAYADDSYESESASLSNQLTWTWGHSDAQSGGSFETTFLCNNDGIEGTVGIFVFSAALPEITANATITEADDTLDSNTFVLIDANATITEADDTLDSNTVVLIDANASIIESDDLLDSNTVILIDANASITEADDTLDSNTFVLIDANGSITETDDLLDSNTVVLIDANASITELDDLLDSSGSVISGIGASVNYTEEDDTLESNTVILIDANGTIIENDDLLDSNTVILIDANASITELDDLLDSNTNILIDANAIFTESDDLLDSNTNVLIDANAIFTESDDLLDSNTNILIDANASITELDDTSSADAYHNIIQNGGFDSDTIWAKGPQWTISGGVATGTGVLSGSENALRYENIPLVDGESYTLIYDITVTSGGIVAVLGGTLGTGRNSSGRYTETIVAGSSHENLQFHRNGSNFTGTIDNVILYKEFNEAILSVTESDDTINAFIGDTNRAYGNLVEEDDLLDSNTVIYIEANASITESDDLLDSNTSVLVVGNTSYTEENDTLDSNTFVLVDANAVYAEENDTADSNTVLIVDANATIIELDDTLDSSGSVVWTSGVNGNVNYNEEDDTTSSNATVDISANATITESDDLLDSNTSILVVGNTSYTEENDTIDSNTVLLIDANAIFTESDDTGAATANVIVTANATITESDDLLDGSVSVITGVGAYVDYTEENDTLTSSIVSTIEANTTITESDDTTSSNTDVDIVINAVINENDDTLDSSTGQVIAGTTNYTEEDDSISSNTLVIIDGILNATEEGDTVSSTAYRVTHGNLNVTEEDDSISSNTLVAIDIISTVTEIDDTLNSLTDVLISANSTFTEENDTLDSFFTRDVLCYVDINETDDSGSASSFIGTPLSLPVRNKSILINRSKTTTIRLTSIRNKTKLRD